MEIRIKKYYFKEDDFLSYSNNFILIENFINLSLPLMLFYLYVTLLMNPDVQLIFQWIKDILKEDFQPAYF